MIESIEFEWKEKQEELRLLGLEKKEQQALHIERRKMEVLAKLRDAGGPFVSCEEVRNYMDHAKNEDEAQKRLRDEITFQRDSSKSLPRSSHLFKIMTTDKTTKKRRVLSAAGFADNLERLLNISGGKQTVTVQDFRAAMSNSL